MKFTNILTLTVLSLSAASAGAWSPDKASLRQLKPAESVGKYQIRPPAGSTVQRKSASDGSRASIWAGAARPDQTRPSFMVFFVSPPPGSKYTLSQVFNILQSVTRHNYSHWTQTPTQQGTVSDLRCLRCYWQGTKIEDGRPQHGFSYLLDDGGKFVQLTSRDADAYQKSTLPLAEAAALTFKKSDAALVSLRHEKE